MSLIVGKGGQDVGAVSSYILPILGVVTIVTTFVTPYILKLGTKLNISSNTSEEKK
jgi:CPA2 family monovalent cation:H+ antiporter-2